MISELSFSRIFKLSSQISDILCSTVENHSCHIIFHVLITQVYLLHDRVNPILLSLITLLFYIHVLSWPWLYNTNCNWWFQVEYIVKKIKTLIKSHNHFLLSYYCHFLTERFQLEGKRFLSLWLFPYNTLERIE